MVRKFNRRQVLTTVGGASVVGLAGCLGDIGGGGDGGEITYGVLMPETGDLGSLGVSIRDGALLVESQLADETDFEFDVQTGDTETDPEAGISAAQNLVDAGVPAVVGPAASNVNLQVTRQIFIPNQVVGISPSSTAPAVTDLDDDGYIFRTAPSDALQGPVMAEVIMDNLDASTTGTLYLNDDYGQALEESYVAAFEDNGGEVTDRVSFEPEQASYASQLGSALDADPDVLMVVGFPQSGITLFRDYYDNYADDWDGNVIVPDGLIDGTLPDEVGNPMNDVWGTAPSAAGPGADRFAELYEEEFDSEPAVFNSHAYDAAAVISLASVAAGDDPSGTDIRDNIREVANPGGETVDATNLAEGLEMVADGDEVNYQGASSGVDFDDNGDMQAVSYDVLRYQDGEIETQETVDFEN
ncbi:ABC transporter substrate-binding protein [Halobacteria archaeon AArc-curdl1]|uniref:ABC transporter substrate-binding protein n=1 Tax=Natronosalvus hydrolyticus TaxID=2979988 RepID=A0AAP3E6J9_9EURY|nr:ABC transporter substrate-binding protein [Halobacteria archaeon AArc-curdl1]